jgi:hypothetical protein
MDMSDRYPIGTVFGDMLLVQWCRFWFPYFFYSIMETPFCI